MASKKNNKKTENQEVKTVEEKKARKPYPDRETRVARVQASIDKIKANIEKENEKIANLEAKKERILTAGTKKPKNTTNALLKKAKEMGMTDAEIAEKLGISLEDETPSEGESEQ